MTRTIFVFVFVATAPASVRADGGELRYSGVRGSYRVAIFTAPVSPRAGPVDVSVLIQDAVTDQTRPDVPVFVSVHPVDRPCCRDRRPATEEGATNKLFRAATFELTGPGRWRVEVEVGDPPVGEPASFEVETAAPRPAWLELAPWILWPFAVVALGVFHRWLVNRRRVSLNY